MTIFFLKEAFSGVFFHLKYWQHRNNLHACSVTYRLICHCSKDSKDLYNHFIQQFNLKLPPNVKSATFQMGFLWRRSLNGADPNYSLFIPGRIFQVVNHGTLHSVIVMT